MSCLTIADLTVLLDRLPAEPSEAEAEVKTNLKRAQSLRQAILSKAFTGDVQ